MLASIVQMIKFQTQPLSLHKVHAHTDIQGNEAGDKIATKSTKIPHCLAHADHEQAHTTPYYLRRDDWPLAELTPYKGPIRFLQAYLHQKEEDNNTEKA